MLIPTTRMAMQKTAESAEFAVDLVTDEVEVSVSPHKKRLGVGKE
jgi:hypothetical protein